MTLIHYVGSSDSRTIFATDFAANGVNDQATTTWNEPNIWQVNVSTGAGNYLLTLSDFSLTGINRPGTGGGPPGPPPGDTGLHPSLATHDALGLATQAELDAAVAGFVSGAHPNLASHDALGLATQTELDAVALAKLNANDASVTNARTPTDASVTTAKIATGGIAQSAVTNLATDIANKVLKAGDTMTGPLVLPGNAASALHAIPKQQLDAAISGLPPAAHPNLAAHDTLGLATQVELDAKLALNGGTMTGPLFLVGDAPTALQAVPKQQLDASITALGSIYETKAKSVTVLTGAGIDETGVTDSTAAIQTLVTNAAGPVVGVPGATYKWSSLNLKNGSDVRGNGASLVCTAASGAGAFTGSNLTNVAVSGWKASGNVGAVLVKMIASKVIDVLRNDLTNLGMFRCDSANISVYTGSTEGENADILVKDNRAVAPATLNTICVGLYYASDCLVTHNRIEGFDNGALFWGGDANVNVNGAIANPRKSKRITMTFNNVIGPSNGGLWGSMGEDIRICDNTVRDCGDVGIDFEGCFNARANRNTVSDCDNGNFATFSLCRNISFAHNTSLATGQATCQYLFKVYNSTADSSKATGNGVIKLTNNALIRTNGVGSGVVIEACHHIIIRGNHMKNTYIFAQTNNMNHVSIINNDMEWDVAASTALDAITVGANRQAQDGFPPRIRIGGNTLISPVSQPPASRGIYSNQDDPNSSPTVDIWGNDVYLFPIDIQSQWGSPSNTNPAVVRIWDNNVFNSIAVTNLLALIPQNERRWGNKRIFTGGTVTGGASLTVTGSRGANAALTSLLSHMATLGLIVDSSVV